ncbi:hypothetical protein YP76_06885 [Sphingobium chungbukense]|uniref:Uncharacterized protein n=2 Tax=Sphingobium chungbukense TaxID=56193 RepID=A0A0M3AS22_9SPHN|nr:hypothetical protein YP76_06885 [Sphingobium chungbukense]
MFVTHVSINREGYFGAGYGKPDASKPFRCTMELHGQHGKVELNLSPEMSERIVSLVAEEVAAAGRATADALTASIIDHTPQIAA